MIYAQANGLRTVANPAVLNSATNQFTPSPISLNTPGQQVYLTLYGTGIRHAGNVTATINGVNIPMIYFGAQGADAGLDQINIGRLPASLANSGTVALIVTVDGLSANTVIVNIQ